MFDVDTFISDCITHRRESMFAVDVERNKSLINKEINNKKILVIGGAGTIGASFIKALLPFRPAKLMVIDVNENALTELTRDLRSTHNLFVPQHYTTYPIAYSDPLFDKIYHKEKGFDIVANFSAHKHVRSEKDVFSVQALLENNVLKVKYLLDTLKKYPPQHFFCVSTDKAANPVNIMGASKKLMEELIMTYSSYFKVTTARFANVAFSNASLLAGFLERMAKKQAIAAPSDVKRYFVSPQESGEICLLACILGNNKEIFFPKLDTTQMMTFSAIADAFLQSQGYSVHYCQSEEEAKAFAAAMPADSKRYPVYYHTSDTTGEKDFEEFFVPGEKINTSRFRALGVIEDYAAASLDVWEERLQQLEKLFALPELQKSQIVEMLTRFLPTFAHMEKDKYLDQKM
ncbi:MAG: polysaccharide biosynthesis protein [Bacteroidales bacterium]|nr:polysaccharide biosynthesis protein [Bacteroidales bacterium]